MDWRKFGITQASTQRPQRGGTQEFERDGSCVHLLLHFVEQFTRNTAWVDETGIIGSRCDQQDTERWLKGYRKPCQFALRQATYQRNRIARAQHQETLLIVEQFPG